MTDPYISGGNIASGGNFDPYLDAADATYIPPLSTDPMVNPDDDPNGDGAFDPWADLLVPPVNPSAPTVLEYQTYSTDSPWSPGATRGGPMVFTPPSDAHWTAPPGSGAWIYDVLIPGPVMFVAPSSPDHSLVVSIFDTTLSQGSQWTIRNDEWTTAQGWPVSKPYYIPSGDAAQVRFEDWGPFDPVTGVNPIYSTGVGSASSFTPTDLVTMIQQSVQPYDGTPHWLDFGTYYGYGMMVSGPVTLYAPMSPDHDVEVYAPAAYPYDPNIPRIILLCPNYRAAWDTRFDPDAPPDSAFIPAGVTRVVYFEDFGTYTSDGTDIIDTRMYQPPDLRSLLSEVLDLPLNDPLSFTEGGMPLTHFAIDTTGSPHVLCGRQVRLSTTYADLVTCPDCLGILESQYGYVPVYDPATPGDQDGAAPDGTEAEGPTVTDPKPPSDEVGYVDDPTPAEPSAPEDDTGGDVVVGSDS